MLVLSYIIPSHQLSVYTTYAKKIIVEFIFCFLSLSIFTCPTCPPFTFKGQRHFFLFKKTK